MKADNFPPYVFLSGGTLRKIRTISPRRAVYRRDAGAWDIGVRLNGNILTSEVKAFNRLPKYMDGRTCTAASYEEYLNDNGKWAVKK